MGFLFGCNSVCLHLFTSSFCWKREPETADYMPRAHVSKVFLETLMSVATLAPPLADRMKPRRTQTWSRSQRTSRC